MSILNECVKWFHTGKVYVRKMSIKCDEQVQCVICDKALIFQEFKKHIKFIVNIKNKTSIVTCETKYVESKKALEEAAKDFEQNNETFACDVCEKPFYYFENLKSHFEMVHDRKKFYKPIPVETATQMIKCDS